MNTIWPYIIYGNAQTHLPAHQFFKFQRQDFPSSNQIISTTAATKQAPCASRAMHTERNPESTSKANHPIQEIWLQAAFHYVVVLRAYFVALLSEIH